MFTSISRALSQPKAKEPTSSKKSKKHAKKRSALEGSSGNAVKTSQKKGKKNTDLPEKNCNTSRPFPFSSESVNVQQILEENQRPAANGHNPATRQLFDVQIYPTNSINPEDSTDAEALLINNMHPPSMAITTQPLNQEYRLTGGEEIRPVTPRLLASLRDVSASRIRIDPQTMSEYRDMLNRYPHITNNRHIFKIPAANASDYRFDNAHLVGDGETRTIVLPANNNHVFAINRVSGSIACGATAHTSDGQQIITLSNYIGIDPHSPTLEEISPIDQVRDTYNQLVNTAAAIGPNVQVIPDTMKLYLAGGELAPAGALANNFMTEAQFLHAANHYFANATSRFYSVLVDTNNENQTIFRNTNDDHASHINVVLGARAMMVSHGRFNLNVQSES